jgi:PIN domain nuclease of toxin-antitoxin system
VKRTLLDTECWLFWHLCPERLGAAAMELLEARRSPLLLSAASSWEIAIKVGLGKLELPAPPERFVPEQLAADEIEPLAVEHAHALHVGRLPPHHRDPFDRLLIAQAQLERCALLTTDAQLLDYEIDLVWGARGDPPSPRRRRRR